MKLFAGRLPYELTDQELQELFEKFGEVVSAKIIINRDTGRSKGFGFVEMANSENAKKAMESLNESQVNGRAIVVNEAHEKKF